MSSRYRYLKIWIQNALWFAHIALLKKDGVHAYETDQFRCWDNALAVFPTGTKEYIFGIVLY